MPKPVKNTCRRVQQKANAADGLDSFLGVPISMVFPVGADCIRDVVLPAAAKGIALTKGSHR
jgi:hypothetical protein